MPHPTIREGSRGPEVARLTAILKRRGYNDFPARVWGFDSVFGRIEALLGLVRVPD